jgi:hypothetical protein
MSKRNSRRVVRFASAGVICATLSFGTAGVALAGQSSHSHGHSSFGQRDDQGQSGTHARGVVTALGTNSITVKDRHGISTVYTTTSGTTYFEGATAGSVADLAVNENVGLELTSTTPQTVTKVVICLTKSVGTVTAVAGDVITITGWNKSTSIVDVSTTTTYTSGGAASSLAAVVVGAQIEAIGLPGTTAGTLNANSVNVEISSGHGHGHGHGLGFGNKGGQGQDQSHSQDGSSFGRHQGRGFGRGRH